jgi:hypothetical protein
LAEEGGEEDDEENEGDEEEEEEEEEEYVPIMRINRAEQAFPLSFVPKTRAVENELQSVVLVPAPYVAASDVSNAAVKCIRATNEYCRCFQCCGPTVLLGNEGDVVRHERDFLGGDNHFELFKWADGQKVTSLDLHALHEVTTAGSEGASQPAALRPGQGSMRSDDNDEETDPLFDPKAARIDGIYNDNPPLLASILLDSEHVPVSIAQMSAANLQLSRATQRILRDLLGGIQAQSVRKKWVEMNRKPSKPEEPKKRPDVPGEVHLLQQLSSAPVLQIIENPVTGGNTQPLVPKSSLSFGGQLGQWGNEGSLADKFGALPRGWSGRRGGQRAKFKLHIHQLLITDHPLMSYEERQLIRLKEIYAQYRSLFEQKILEFLTQRLLALTTELEQAVGPRAGTHRELNEEELLSLKGVYRDLVETLPALNKLNEAVDSLSSNVYEGWREIQDLRLRAGFSRTAAELTVRKVKSIYVAPSNAPGAGASRLGRRAAEDLAHLDNEAAADAGNSGEFWANLKQSLLATPGLLKRAQELLFRPEVAEEDEVFHERPLESARGSEFGGSQVAIVASEQQRAKQASLARVISVVTSAVEKLVENNGVIPKYVLRLSETGQVTPENQITPGELKRRAVLKNTRVRAVVKINGRVVTSTAHHTLKASTLSVDFNRSFEFRVVHQPMTVTVDLFTSDVGAWSGADSYLATVSVPFPAQSNSASGGSSGGGANGAGAGGAGSEGVGRHQHVTHSFTPTCGWYSFASQLVAGAVDRRVEVSETLSSNIHHISLIVLISRLSSIVFPGSGAVHSGVRSFLRGRQRRGHGRHPRGGRCPDSLHEALSPVRDREPQRPRARLHPGK